MTTKLLEGILNDVKEGDMILLHSENGEMGAGYFGTSRERGPEGEILYATIGMFNQKLCSGPIYYLILNSGIFTAGPKEKVIGYEILKRVQDTTSKPKLEK